MTTVRNEASQPEIGHILLVLFATGWSANHFVSVLPVLRSSDRMSAGVAAAAFGIYALGILPGLLGGGVLSDRIGRAPTLLTGAIAAACGNLLMAFWHDIPGVYVGRLIVGAGVGLAVSAGTAWAGDLRGKKGATLAGIALTAGFAFGPLASGAIAEIWTRVDLVAPFAVTAALTLAAVANCWRRSAGRAADSNAAGSAAVQVNPSVGRALYAALPMGLWVFSCVSIAFVTLAARMADRDGGPWVPGVAAALSLGSGVVIQFVARRYDWGPRSGAAGATLAALGFLLVADFGTTPSWAQFVGVAVILGCAYGLCLREGLIDVEMIAPAASRGLTMGIFYACTYLGFGLPLLLVALRPAVGDGAPLVTLAVLALIAAALRMVQVQAGSCRPATEIAVEGRRATPA